MREARYFEGGVFIGGKFKKKLKKVMAGGIMRQVGHLTACVRVII